MHVACYADAGLSADSTRTAKSTTGYWVEFVSNGHRAPIAWCSKRQTSTSVSIAEAELYHLGPLRMYEDNDAVPRLLRVVTDHYSPKLVIW
eukprot:6490962-Amphidinium_carterae.2